MGGTGRYADAEVATTTVPDGAGGRREVRYLRQRPAPRPATLPPLALHRVGDDDRLDLLAARYLGDPLAGWRLAEAAGVLDPDELTATPGAVVVVPAPEL